MAGQPATRSTKQVNRETFNQLLAAANRRTTGTGPLSTGRIPPAVGCLVKWTGAALPAFSVLGVGESVIDPDDRPFDAGDVPIFEGAAPADGDAICITREPCPAAGERLLRAVLLGVAEVDVDVTDAGHTFAAPIVGDTAKLASAEAGTVRILHKPAGMGVGRCVVLLQDVSTAASGNAVPPFAVLTETTGASSWQGREVNIGSGAWSSDGNSGTDNARPFLMDGSTFTPKPTANVLLFEDSGGDLGYLPIQSANRVSGTDYPGYVSTGAQTWNGDKTFGDRVYVNDDATASGTVFAAYFNSGVKSALLSAIDNTTYSCVVVGDGTPSGLFVYGEAHAKRLFVVPGGISPTAPGGIPSTGAASLVYPYNPTTYPDTLAFFGASGAAVLLTPSAGILSISSGIITSTGAFNTWVDAYDYKTTEHVGPFATFTGGTVSNGSGGYYFLNGLYISGSGSPIMAIDTGTTGLTVSGTTTQTLAGTLDVANGGTGSDLSATGPGIVIQDASGNPLSIFQHSATGETSGFTAGSGAAVNDDSTFTGNVGTTAYNLNDIVKALKGAKLLAD